MSFLSSQNRQSLLVLFVTFLIIFEMTAYVITTPRPAEQFIQLYVLGENMLASDYYPNDDPNIRLGDLIRWYLGVTNFMGNLQLVEIRIKLGNQTISPPDDQQATPSPAPIVTEFRRYIQNNETWQFPFIWRITSAVAVGNATRISDLQINNQTLTLQDSSARNGYNFRIIIELWTLQAESSSFQFGWLTNTGHRVAWLQVWFNMTSSPP